jgi:hypothetical protein
MTAAQRSSTLILSTPHKSPKAIPYGGSKREDGGENHGFRPLKGKPEECALIAEVQDNSALKNALITLNGTETPFFTVGCEKSCNRHSTGAGYWMKGYVEVAFNYKELVQDAQNYFKLFFDFNLNWFWKQKQEAVVHYHFELEMGHFWQHLSLHEGAFTTAVWIQTEVLQSEKDAQNAWAWAPSVMVVTGLHRQSKSAMRRS